MALYVFRAMNVEGKTVRGQITAANDIDLEARLKGLSLDLLNAREIKESRTIAFGGVKLKDKIMFCVHMEQLDRAGVPIMEALADVRDSTDSAKLKNVLADIYESVKSGLMLSEALAKQPKTFDAVFVGLIAAGEKTGNLHESFANLAKHLKWSSEIRRKVRKAMAMPIFTLFIMMAAIGILMVVLVPQLTEFMKSNGYELPFLTRALIATSGFFAAWWWLVMPLPVGLFIFVKFLKRVSYGFAYNWDRVMLKMPIIGGPIRKIDMSRFVHFFSILYTSGIDILDCLKVGQQVVKNKVLLDSLNTVRRIVGEGNSLTGALRISNQFPGLVVRMFKVGEDSGNMKEALEHVNFFYEREVNDAVDTIVGTIKPALTVLLGFLLVWIVIAMFGPLYDSFSKIQY